MADDTIFQVDEGVDKGVRSLVQSLRILFFCLRVLIAVMVVWVFFSGAFFVKEHQEAMLFRFGALIKKGDSEILRPGNWYWAWPYPIDEVRRVPAQRSVTVASTQFWPQRNPNLLPEQLATMTAPNALVPGQDGYLVTGDANIMHMVWSVTYRVSNPKDYYLNFRQEDDRQDETSFTGPEEGVEHVIECLLAQAALNVVARWPVEDVLVLTRQETDQARQSLGNAVEFELNRNLGRLRLGIEVQAVNLVEVQPPLATQDSFREVVDAAQEYQTQIDNAKAYAERTRTEAEGTSSQVIAEAQQYRDRVVKSVDADRKYFEQVLEEYEKSPEIALALYTDLLREVLEKSENKYIVHSRGDGRQEVRLLLGPIPKKTGADADGELDSSGNE